MGPLSGLKRIRSVDANRTVKDALLEAVQAHRGRSRISVTDLLNPMQAYSQRTHPGVVISPERLQLMFTGTGFHELFGAAVSTEEFLEQFVERDGVVGQIDIYETIPIELKTTGLLPEDLEVQRPTYVEQLALYCYLAANPNGAVVVCRRAEYGRVADLRAFRVAFNNLDLIGERMREQRDLLTEALATNDSSKLAQCEWWTGIETIATYASAPRPSLVRG